MSTCDNCDWAHGINVLECACSRLVAKPTVSRPFRPEAAAERACVMASATACPAAAAACREVRARLVFRVDCAWWPLVPPGGTCASPARIRVQSHAAWASSDAGGNCCRQQGPGIRPGWHAAICRLACCTHDSLYNPHEQHLSRRLCPNVNPRWLKPLRGQQNLLYLSYQVEQSQATPLPQLPSG